LILDAKRTQLVTPSSNLRRAKIPHGSTALPTPSHPTAAVWEVKPCVAAVLLGGYHTRKIT
ncbi:MAG: hypothetical protein AAGF31_04385, partial [Planctomycetota bacterium]